MKTIQILMVILLLNTMLLASNENPTKEEIAKLYVATFNRAPDSVGLDYWFRDSGLNLLGIAQSFFDQEETLSLYPPGSSNKNFVEAVYNNLFNRNPDTGGLNYWENDLNLGNVSRNSFIMAVINGAKDNEDGFDATTLENKKEVGVYFANKGLDNKNQARYTMEGVTSDDSTVSFIKNKIDEIELPHDVWDGFGNLTTQNVDRLGRNASALIPGCSYASDNTLFLTDVRNVEIYKKMVKNLIENEKSTKKVSTLRSRAINETIAGDCGGSATKVGTHDSGDDDLVYTYNDYCVQSGTKQTVLNGVLNSFTDGEPSVDGPIMQSISATTNASGLSMTTTVDEEISKEILHLNNFLFTNSGNLSADLIKTVSSTNGTYEVRNVNIVTGSNNDQSFIQVNSATYIDPDVGTVTMTTTQIPTGDTATGFASITVSSGGSTAIFSTDDVSSGIFTLKQNGKTIGALDCLALQVN